MNIPHHEGVDDYAAFDRLSSGVYIAARAGAVDCTAAFDLAAAWLEERPHDAAATELATLSLECGQASQPRMAEVALHLLATANFRPGFKEEPAWLACLEDAMRQVNHDVAATGIRHPCKLRVHDDDGLNWSVNAYVETWDGYTGIAQGIYPASGADPVSALIDVADDAQDALMPGTTRMPPCGGAQVTAVMPSRQSANGKVANHAAPTGVARGGEGTDPSRASRAAAAVAPPRTG